MASVYLSFASGSNVGHPETLQGFFGFRIQIRIHERASNGEYSSWCTFFSPLGRPLPRFVIEDRFTKTSNSTLTQSCAVQRPQTSELCRPRSSFSQDSAPHTVRLFHKTYTCTVLHPNSTDADFSFCYFLSRLTFQRSVSIRTSPEGADYFKYSRESEDLSARTSEYRISSIVWYWPPTGSDSLPSANPHSLHG